MEDIDDYMVEAFNKLQEIVVKLLRPSRETSLALTKLDEAQMWVNRSLLMNGVQTEKEN